jgi:hypothetical protein
MKAQVRNQEKEGYKKRYAAILSKIELLAMLSVGVILIVLSLAFKDEHCIGQLI